MKTQVNQAFSYLKGLKAENLTKQQIELFDRIKEYKNQLTGVTSRSFTNNKLGALRGVPNRAGAISANTQRKQLTNLWMSNDLFDLKTSRSQYMSSPLIENIMHIKKRPVGNNESTGGINVSGGGDVTGRSNRFIDEFDVLCPVSLHHKLAFGKFDTDCKCKKFIVPMVNDVEYDYLIRLLPAEQLAVVVIIDS
jgi:hypothetical protein